MSEMLHNAAEFVINHQLLYFENIPKGADDVHELIDDGQFDSVSKMIEYLFDGELK